MKLEKIKYSDLNSRQKEIFNFQKVAGLLADYGFNCIKLTDDWQGADFLAYHKAGKETLKVQLKSRLTIARKYIGKSLFMAFPINGAWHLIAHDELVATLEEHTEWLNSESWQKHGTYSSAKPNKKLITALHSSKL
ncbi:MAG: hypothetical protein LZF63_02080 [Nitrosomonas sp.]|nr:hypothetical protein [Nitrosomonas sp.]MCG7755432.1 hypothetical protein [Nitrosomonas sp.]